LSKREPIEDTKKYAVSDFGNEIKEDITSAIKEKGVIRSEYQLYEAVWRRQRERFEDYLRDKRRQYLANQDEIDRERPPRHSKVTLHKYLQLLQSDGSVKTHRVGNRWEHELGESGKLSFDDVDQLTLDMMSKSTPVEIHLFKDAQTPVHGLKAFVWSTRTLNALTIKFLRNALSMMGASGSTALPVFPRFPEPPVSKDEADAYKKQGLISLEKGLPEKQYQGVKHYRSYAFKTMMLLYYDGEAFWKLNKPAIRRWAEKEVEESRNLGAKAAKVGERRHGTEQRKL
jgi:hypothetical protein